MAAMCLAASCFWGCASSSAVIRCSPLNGKPKENFSLSWTLPCQVFSCCDKQSNWCTAHCPFLFLLHTSFRLLCPTHSHTYTHTHSLTLTHPLTHIHTLTMHSHTHILSQTHTHINTRTLTHTHTHTNMHMDFQTHSLILTHSHTPTVWLERSRKELRKDREDRKRKGWGKKFPRGTNIKG